MNPNAAYFHAPNHSEEPSPPDYFSVARAAAARIAHRRQLERELAEVDRLAAGAAAEVERLQRLRAALALQLTSMTP
jgi:hypothetical protein